MPKISIAVPIHNMQNKNFFLKRCLDSVERQTFKDYEIVVTEEGKMAENTNAAIKKSKGELIKILYMDDFLAYENSLQEIVDNFKGGWLVTGCDHFDGNKFTNGHLPVWQENIHLQNTIGSPSVLTILNNDPLFFDESMTWMLDADYYKRLYNRYGVPTTLNTINVTIGTGDHQMTNLLSAEVKQQEYEYMLKKH